MTASSEFSHWESCWLTEIVRRHEERHGALDDTQAAETARKAPADIETRLFTRARELGRQNGWDAEVSTWRQRRRFGLALAGLVAFITGIAAAWGVLGNGARAVNIVWAFGGLLGVHGLALLLWLGGMLLRRKGMSGGGWLGKICLKLPRLFDRSPQTTRQMAALGDLFGRSGTAPWLLGALTHLLWTLALLGALGGLVLLFATRRYGFIWETTILPPGFFVRFVEISGSLPALLGFAVPDAASIAASGLQTAQPEAARQIWASWLIGCLIVYGIIPRALLTAFCYTLLRRRLREIRLDPSLPGYIRLRARLLPEAERIGVLHPDLRLARERRAQTRPAAGQAGLLIGMELGPDLEWPPAALQAFDSGIVDTREQRKAAMEQMQASPPARLVIAVDIRLTPDRGSIALISRLADRAMVTRIWPLAENAPDGRSPRLAQWYGALEEIGFSAKAVLKDEEVVRIWLEGAARNAGEAT